MFNDVISSAASSSCCRPGPFCQVRLDISEKIHNCACSEALEQNTQRSLGCTIPGSAQGHVAWSWPMAGGWNEMGFNVPSKPNHPMTLWKGLLGDIKWQEKPQWGGAGLRQTNAPASSGLHTTSPFYTLFSLPPCLFVTLSSPAQPLKHLPSSISPSALPVQGPSVYNLITCKTQIDLPGSAVVFDSPSVTAGDKICCFLGLSLEKFSFWFPPFPLISQLARSWLRQPCCNKPPHISTCLDQLVWMSKFASHHCHPFLLVGFVSFMFRFMTFSFSFFVEFKKVLDQIPLKEQTLSGQPPWHFMFWDSPVLPWLSAGR